MKDLFQTLRLKPTSATYDQIGKITNTRDSEKAFKTSLAYCRERIEQFIAKCKQSGEPIQFADPLSEGINLPRSLDDNPKWLL